MYNLNSDKLDSDQETTLNKLFMKVQVKLVEDVGQSAFKSWLSSLRLNKIDKNILYLSLPSSFLSDWVIPHYGNKIDTICKRVFVGIKKTKITVNPKFKGKSSSLSLQALIRSSSITPDSQVIVLEISSTSIMLFIFSNDKTT